MFDIDTRPKVQGLCELEPCPAETFLFSCFSAGIVYYTRV